MEIVGYPLLTLGVVLEVGRPVDRAFRGDSEPCAFACVMQKQLTVRSYCDIFGNHPVKGFLCCLKVGGVKESQPVHLCKEVDEHRCGRCLKIVCTLSGLVHHLPPHSAVLVLEFDDCRGKLFCKADESCPMVLVFRHGGNNLQEICQGHHIPTKSPCPDLLGSAVALAPRHFAGLVPGMTQKARPCVERLLVDQLELLDGVVQTLLQAAEPLAVVHSERSLHV